MGHSIENREGFAAWAYTLAENPISPELETAILEHRAATRHGVGQGATPEPYTYSEIIRLSTYGATEPAPVLPFYLSNEDARKAAIRERGADAIRAEFEHFKSKHTAHAEKAHEAKAALRVIASLSPTGEISPESYRAYLSRFKTDLPFLFGIRHFPLPESMRETHTYITAGSGMGKSTVLRDMSYHYAKNPESPSLIVIDPHGSLTREISRFNIPDLDKRLIYFQANLGEREGLYPVLNPLEIERSRPKKSGEPSEKDFRKVSIAAEEFVRQFRILLRDTDSTTSQQMESILKPCVKALMLRNKPSTLADLAAFLEPESKDKARESIPYYEEARRILPNPADRHFLDTDFYAVGYKQTKLSIRTRLRVLLGSDAIYRCVNGKSTIDLRKAMNSRGKVILFNLSGIGQEATDTLGRFFTGMIQSIAMERETIPEEFRPKTHLFIDECQRFLNPTVEKILTESRKFGLYLTLAQQIVGNGMSGDLERVVLGNTGIKVCGLNEHKSLSTMSKNMGIEEKELKTLRPRQFYASGAQFPPIRFKTANIEKYITDEAWEARERAQLAAHYRMKSDARIGADERDEDDTDPENHPPAPPDEFRHEL